MAMKKVWIRLLCLLLVGELLGAMLPGALPQAAAASRQVNIKVDSVKHCDVYYCEGDGLIPIQQGGKIDKITTGNYAILFFAAPHSGYALSAMTATSAAGEYYTISDGASNGAGSEFYSYGSGKNVSNLKNAGYTDSQIERILTDAIAKGCDGALLFSRPASNGAVIGSNLIFGAERLPTLEKHIKSVTPKSGGQAMPYTEGMSVGLGDIINYSLDVTFYPLENKEFSIAYSDVYVTDEKTGNTEAAPIRITAPTAEDLKGLIQEKIVTAQVEYTITQQDVEQGGVSNEAQLHYQYKSLHSAGQLATVSDAQASLTVQSSVQYQYESGTPGMQLPAALTLTDYTYYASGVSVPVQPHQVESPYWDEGNDGYWTLQNSGQWSDGATAYDPGSSFPMPSVPVTLTATWAFTKAPGIAIEKDGSFVQAPDADDVQALQQITYQVSYQLTVRNIGGESLNQFTISDRTLPDTLTSMTAKIGGSEIALEGVSCSANTWTFSLPDDGLPAGQELVLSYSCSRSGTLDSKKMLTDTSTATATARGVQSGVDVQDDTILSMYIVLEDRIMLMPADIVIYAGGDEDGSNVAPGTNLPEPGFFVTLPLEAEQKLRQVLNKQEQIDLSDYLTFSDSNQNVWGLEPFSGDYSKAHGSFLYRLVPKKVVDGQKKIEMQFYDEARHEYIQQSAFQITNALQQEYAMTIYPGEIPAVNPHAVLAVGGQEIGSYGLGVTPGKLIIRGTTGALTTGSIRAASEASKPIDQITACAEANVEYYVNQSQLAVTDKNKVALLVDNIVDVSYHQTLKALANTVVSRLDHQNRLQFQFQYLDLVDTSMGNAWVTASAPLEVVWPYPDGTDKNDEFTIIHYKGMDRDYNLSEMAGLRLGTDYTLEVYTTGTLWQDTGAVTYHSLTRGDNGMAFTVDSFSPYVLIWEGEEADPSAGGGSSGGGSSNPPTQPKPEEEPETENKPDGLNTTEHYAYLMGRGDGGVQPLAPITRGEVATIWFRLLTDETRAHNWSTAHLYPDVAAGSWYHNTIATVTHMDVMHGDTEGTFRPEEEITRAEFVASAVRFFGTPSTESALRFTDVPADAWYADAVYAGAALGLIEGDGDGAFRPEDTITRAEVAAIVNRMLGRKPRGGMLLEQSAPWVDNPKDAWYYADMLEASVGHDYVWLGTGERQVERWTGLLPARDWTALEQFGPQQQAEDISL